MQENIASAPDVAVTARRAKLPVWRRLRAPMRRDRLSAGIILFALLIITGMWAVIEAYIVRDRDDRIAEVMRENANLARAFEEHTVRTLDYIDATLLALKDRYEAEGAKVDLPAFYRQMRPNPAVLINAAITDASGQIILSAVPAQSVSFADREHFKVHLSGPDSGLFFISKPVLDRISKQWSIVTTRRANNEEGKLVGVVAASIDPEYFSGFYRDVYRDTGNVVTLVGTDGIVRARLAADSADLGQDISRGSAFQRMMASSVEPSAAAVTYIGSSAVDGIEGVYAARRISGYPLLVFVGTPVTEVLAPEVARTRNYRLAATGASVLIGFFAVTLVSFSRRRSESARALHSASDLLERTGAIARVGGWELDLRTQVLSWSGQTCRIHEVDPPVAPALAQAIAFYAPEARPVIAAAVRAGIEQGTPWDLELPLITAKGRRIWTHSQGSVVFQHGEAVTLVGAFQDITGRKTADLREATRSLTMSALANGAPLAEVLTTLVLGAEAEHPGTLGSVLLLDAAGTHLLTGAAPSLPAFYNEAVHGAAIGPAVGSCGTAAFTGERVLVTDIQTDPLWTDYKALATQAGLAACWSEPIRGARGQVVGTFACYHAQPCAPSEAEIGTIVAAAQLAAVAIERTQANEALRRGTQLLEASQSTAKLGGWELDLGSKQLFWTAETYRIHDTSPGEFNPTVDAGVGYFLPESRKIFSAAMQAAMERGEGYDLVLETLTTNGRRIDVRTTCAVTLHEGRPAKLTGIVQDITERMMAESQLRLLEVSVAQLNDAVIITQADLPDAPGSRIAFVNDAAERLTGYTRAELVGQTPRLFQGPKTDRAELDRIATALHHRKPVFAELINYTKAGTEYWIELNITPVQTAAGEATHFVAIERDITGRKQGEAEIHRLNAELEQRVRDRTAELQAVNQELEAFSYSVSHDLRAPLRHLTGFAELLQKNARANLDDQARRHLTFISESAVRMGQLIDDLLAFSRSGRAELRQAPVNLDAMVQQVIQSLHPDTQGRPIFWQIAPLPGVNADANLLRMALTNLFSNALKFTRSRDEATIQMGCTTENEHELIFFIRDNGEGFDMQYVEKLFGVFQRLHATEDFEGTGIGLANVRRIISRHGGRTWAESVLGEGATFYFSLPK